jgi:hypothetical protein
MDHQRELPWGTETPSFRGRGFGSGWDKPSVPRGSDLSLSLRTLLELELGRSSLLPLPFQAIPYQVSRDSSVGVLGTEGCGRKWTSQFRCCRNSRTIEVGPYNRRVTASGPCNAFSVSGVTQNEQVTYSQWTVRVRIPPAPPKFPRIPNNESPHFGSDGCPAVYERQLGSEAIRSKFDLGWRSEIQIRHCEILFYRHFCGHFFVQQPFGGRNHGHGV